MDVCYIGMRMRNARALRNVTAAALASKLGVNRSTVQRYECGLVIRPQLRLLRDAATLLNVDLVWLMGEGTWATPKADERLYLDALENPIVIRPVSADNRPLMSPRKAAAQLDM